VEHFLPERSPITAPAAFRSCPIRFRVGIAIGDVVIHDTDRLGAGVTLAVRVQECAAPVVLRFRTTPTA
jgi:class 3 adenylate cyclase